MLLLLALWAQDNPTRTPEAATAAASYASAASCVLDMAKSVSIERRQIERFPAEALNACSKETESAIQSLAKALPDSPAELARSNVSTNLKIAVRSKLIERLESAAPFNPEKYTDYVLLSKAVNYISCSRLAIDVKVESTFVGDKWFADTTSLESGQATEKVRDWVKTNCQKSRAALEMAFSEGTRSADEKIRKKIEENFRATHLEDQVIEPYLKVARETGLSKQ